MSRPFHQVLARLREASIKRGTYQSQSVVDQQDLRDLLDDYDRIDREYRALHAARAAGETSGSQS